MTKLLERAMAKARTLSDAMQDDIASAILRLAGEEQPVYSMNPDEEASLDTAMTQLERNEFASEATMAAIWEKHGL